MTNIIIQEEITRCKALMNQLQPLLEQTILSIPTEVIGTLDGVAYKSRHPLVHADIYILPQSKHWDTVEKWKSLKDTTNLTISAGSNGNLLFIGYFDDNQENVEKANYKLGYITSIFNSDL